MRITNSESGTTRFNIVAPQSGTGAATFEDGTTETTIPGYAGDRVLKIKGVTESSQVDNIRIGARMNGSSTVSAYDDFTVAVITSLEFERFDSTYFELDPNPGTDGVHRPEEGEGLRVYPDKKNVADVTSGTADRSLVKIKASILPVAANLKVYFASFDLDDPSATGSPIDATDSDGIDNNGQVNNSKSGDFAVPTGVTCDGGETGTTSNLHVSKTECRSASDGTAIPVLKTTMQPGDNFSIAASVDKDYRNGFKVNTSDGSQLQNQANQQIVISGESNPNSVAGVRTKMLTVWRKLHIEVDSMGPGRQNFVQGNVSYAKTLVRNRRSTLKVTSASLEQNRFENGRMVLAYISNFMDVVSNTVDTITVRNSTADSISIASGVDFQMSSQSGARMAVGTVPTGQIVAPSQTVTLTISGTPLDTNAFASGSFYLTPMLRDLIVHGNTADSVEVTNVATASVKVLAGTNFRLYDDDDMNDDGTRDGDENDDVPEPDISLLSDGSDNPSSNVFAPAYIVPRFDLPNFVRNISFYASPTYPDISVLLSSPFFDNAGAHANPDFWTIYLLGAYQPPRYDMAGSTVIRDGDPVIFSTTGQIATIYGASNGGSEEGPPFVRRNLGTGAAIFAEVGRPNEYPTGFGSRPVSRAYTTVHEVGHLFRGVHVDGGLMAPTPVRTSGIFSETSISIIRSTEHP